MEKDLMQGIIQALQKKEELSIPQLCEILNIEDDFIVAEIIGKLEEEGIVELNGFKKICREDGGEINLALYSLVK